MLKQAARRSTLQVEDRRMVLLAAQARKPQDVAKESHEQFIRNALKDRMGWPRREPASDQLKAAAREMAAQLVARDKARGEAMAKAAEEQAARDAAVAQGIADNV